MVRTPVRLAQFCDVPPAGFEPALPPPEGGALSPELRGLATHRGARDPPKTSRAPGPAARGTALPAQVVADHQLAEQDVGLVAGRLAQLVDLGLCRDPGHQAIGAQLLRATGHPCHPRLARRRRQVPVGEPGLHDPELHALRRRDVVRHAADLGAGGLRVHDHGHLHRLRVVGGHVAGEAGLGRGVARRPEVLHQVAAGVPDSEQQHRDERPDCEAGPPRCRGERQQDQPPGCGWPGCCGWSLPRSRGVVPVSVMPPEHWAVSMPADLRISLMNWSIRPSSTLSTFSWYPHACRDTALSSPGYGLISRYSWPRTFLASTSTWSLDSLSGLYVIQTAPCSMEWTACSLAIWAS